MGMPTAPAYIMQTALLVPALVRLGVAAGLFGYFLRPIATWERALLLGAALILIKQGPATDAAGALTAGLVVVRQLLAVRRATRAGQAHGVGGVG